MGDFIQEYDEKRALEYFNRRREKKNTVCSEGLSFFFRLNLK